MLNGVQALTKHSQVTAGVLHLLPSPLTLLLRWDTDLHLFLGPWPWPGWDSKTGSW